MRPRPPQGSANATEDGEEEEADDRTQQETADAASGIGRETTKLYDVLPKPVRAWLLLRRAGLPATYRANVIDQIQGKFSMEKIASKLRGAWPDTDVAELDRASPSTRAPGNYY